MAPRRRWLRLAGRSTAGLLLVVLCFGLLGAAAFLTFGRDIASRMIHWQLGIAGLPAESLVVTEIGLHRLVVERLALPEGVTVERVTAAFDPVRLARTQRVDRVVVEGAVVSAEVDAEGAISIGGIPLTGEGTEEGGPVVPALPVAEIRFERGHLRLETPAGPVTVPFDATVRSEPSGRLTVEATLTPEAAGMGGAVSVNVILSPDGLLSAAGEIADTRLVSGDLSIDGISGWFALSLALDDPDSRRFDANVTADRIRLGDGLQVEPVQMIYRDRGGPDLALVTIGRPGSGTVISAQAVAGPQGFAIEAGAELERPDLVRELGALLGVAVEAERLSLDITMAMPAPDPGDPRAMLPLEGDVRLSGAGIRAGAGVHVPAVELAGRLTLAEDSLVLEGSRDARLAFRDGGGLELDLALAALDGEGPTVALSWAEGELSGGRVLGEVDGSLSAPFGTFAIDGPLDASLSLRSDDTHLEAVLLGGDFAVEAEGAFVSGAGVRLEVSGTPEEGRVSVDGVLAAAYDLAEGDGLLVDPTALALAARWSGDRLDIEIDGCQSLPGVRYAEADLAVSLTGVSLCAEGSSPLVTVGLAAGRVAAPFSMPAGGTVAVVTPDGTILAGDLPAIQGELAIGTRVELEGRLTGGELRSTGAVLRNTDADVTLRLGADPWLTAEIRRADLRHAALAEVGGLARLAGTVTGTPGAIEATGNVTAGNLWGAVTARHDLATAQGTGRVRVGAYTFVPGGLQPQAVWPGAAALGLRAVSGRVRAILNVGWGTAFTTRGELLLENLSFSADAADVTGLDGTIRARSLDPLTLDGTQELTVTSVDVGVLLQNGRIALSGTAGALRFESVGFDWARGRLTAPPFTIRPGTPIELVLVADGIDASSVMARFPVDGLSITGILDGRVPIRISGSTVTVNQGRLETRGPGVVRYRPSTPPAFAQGGDESVQLLMDAIRNFQYTQLALTLNGRTGDDLQVGLSISGSNPDVYDGYPIALNVNLSGALDQILRRTIEATTIGDRVGDLFR